MLHFGQFQLDTIQKRLFENGKELSIEPKLFELLMLLMAHPQQLVSREFIVESLWSGRYVTDNAINKQIANLRKLLNDDPKQSAYIQTVPKLGYRFICPIETVESNTPSPPIKKALPIYRVPFISLVILGIVVGLLLKDDPKQQVIPQTTEVTRLNGVEWSPVIAPSNQDILFLRQQSTNSEIELWHKDIGTSQVSHIHTETSIRQLLLLTEQSNQTKSYNLYYRLANSERCGIYKGRIEQQQLKVQGSALVNCDQQQIVDAVVDPKERFIIYSARSKTSQAGQIYLLDLLTNTTSLMKQPVSSGSGIVSLDLSKDSNYLLLTLVNGKRHSDLYSLDLSTHELRHKMSFDYHMPTASWNQDATGVFYFAPAPANQIRHRLLDGDDYTTVVSASDYLARDILLAPNGALYFATRNRNFDNVFIGETQNMTLDNSSVYDIAPTLLHQQNAYMFVSKRTGQSQIYLANLQTGQSQILTNFREYMVIRHLQISPTDQYLLFADTHNVWQVKLSQLVDATSPISLQDAELVHTSDDVIINIEWLDHTHFVISALNREKRNLLLNALTNKVKLLPAQWRHIVTDDQNTHQALIIEAESGDGYIAPTNSIISEEYIELTQLEKISSTLPSKMLHPKLANNQVFYITHESGHAVMNQRPLFNGKPQNKRQLNGYYTYDVNHKTLLVSDLVSISGDIHRAELP